MGDKAKNETEKDDTKDDSWAKLGDTISSYFGADKDGAKEETGTGSDEEKSDKKDEKDDDGDKKKNTKDNKKKKKKKKKKEFKPIVETLKEPLEFEFEIMGLKE